MFLDDGHRAVQNVFVYGVGGQLLDGGLRLFAEFLLQQDARIDQVVAS